MKKYEEFLHHILDEAEYLLRQSKNIDLDEFLEDEAYLYLKPLAGLHTKF